MSLPIRLSILSRQFMGFCCIILSHQVTFANSGGHTDDSRLQGSDAIDSNTVHIKSRFCVIRAIWPAEQNEARLLAIISWMSRSAQVSRHLM